MLRLLQQSRLNEKVQAQRFAAGLVVVLAGDLDESAPAILPAVTRGSVAHAVAVGGVGDLFGLACNGAGQFHTETTWPVSAQGISAIAEVFHQARQVAGLVTNLSDKGRDALGTNNLVTPHRSV